MSGINIVTTDLPSSPGAMAILPLHIIIQRLFYDQTGQGVFLFRRKGKGVVAGDGIEILAQIVGKIQIDHKIPKVLWR